MGYLVGAMSYNNNTYKLLLLLTAWAVASVTAGSPLLTWWDFNAHLRKIVLSFDEPMADVFLGPLQLGSQGSCNLQPHVKVPPQAVTSIELTASSTVLILNLDAGFFDGLKVGHLRIASQESIFICLGAGSFLNVNREGNLAVYGGEILGGEGFAATTIVPDDVPPSILRHTLDPIQVYMHGIIILCALLTTTNPEYHQLTEHIFFDEAVDWSSAVVPAITLSIPPNTVRLKCSTIEEGSTEHRLNSRELVVNLKTLCANSTAETSWNDLNVLKAVLGPDWMSSQSVILTLDEGFIADYASPANYAGSVASLTTQEPDCNPCGGLEVTFRSVVCDTVHNAECSVCSCLDGCPLHHFLRANCTAETDTDCAPCSTCILGMYEDAECGTENNVHCKECTKCNDSEWQVSDCTRVQDRICKSCFITSCNEWNEASSSQCKSSEAVQWHKANCGGFNGAS